MNPIVDIYNLVFFQPVYYGLLLLYKYLKDFGLSVVVLTVIIKLILFPLDYKNSKEQEKFLKIKKAIEQIGKKLNGEQKVKEIAAIYQKEKINPFFSLISLIIQLPILVALYQVFLKSTNQINPFFFGVLNLSVPNPILASVAICFQIFYLWLSARMNKEISPLKNPITLLLIPFTLIILIKLPSVISLYFTVTYLLLIVQKYFFHV